MTARRISGEDRRALVYSEDTLLALSGLVPERYHDEVRGCVAPALCTDRGSEAYLSTKRDLETALARQLTTISEIAERMKLGPRHPEIQELLGRHRRLVEKWLCGCIPPVQAEQRAQAAAEPLCAAFLECIRPGLATFIRDASLVVPPAAS